MARPYEPLMWWQEKIRAGNPRGECNPYAGFLRPPSPGCATFGQRTVCMLITSSLCSCRDYSSESRRGPASQPKDVCCNMQRQVLPEPNVNPES